MAPRLMLLDEGTGNEARNNLAYDVVGTPTFSANSTSNNTEVSTNSFVNYALATSDWLERRRRGRR